MVKARGRRRTRMFRKKVCDYYFEHKDDPGITLEKIGLKFGIEPSRAASTVGSWLREDPRYVPLRRSTSEKERIAALSWYRENPGVTFEDVSVRFGYPRSDAVLKSWVAKHPQYGKKKGYAQAHIDSICDYADEHPDESHESIAEKFGYPAHSHTLAEWLRKRHSAPKAATGTPPKRGPKRLVPEDVAREGVERAFANPEESIPEIERYLGLPQGSVSYRVRMDPRWKEDPRSRRPSSGERCEVVEFYFDNPSMGARAVSERFGGRPCPNTVSRWVSLDPRFLDPVSYGYTEEQKKLALDLYFDGSGAKLSDIEKTLGFPINRRAWRCWTAADPRSKGRKTRRAGRYSLEAKAGIVLTVRQDGRTAKEAAGLYNVAEATVKKYLRLYDRGGLAALMTDRDIPRRGGNLQATRKPAAQAGSISEAEIQELIRRNEELEARNQELQFENDVCHAIFDVLKKDPRLCEGQLLTVREKTLVINALRPRYKLRTLLERFSMPKSTYEYNRNALLRPDKYLKIRAFIRDAFEKSGHSYGYRRIAAVLRMPVLEEDERGISGYGVAVDEKVVRRLMREEGIVTLPAMRLLRYNSYRGTVGRIAPNLLKRDFSSDVPRKKLLTDVTEFHLNNYKVYLSPVIDCFNGEVVSWTISQSPNLELVTTMLKGAIERVGKGFDIIIHSDQGWAYQHAAYRQMLVDVGWRQSMSRKGCCSDNSACEGFFGRLKNEFFYNHDFTGCSPDEFMARLSEWIAWHNEGRIKEGLGYTSPVLYREQWESEHAELVLAA